MRSHLFSILLTQDDGPSLRSWPARSSRSREMTLVPVSRAAASLTTAASPVSPAAVKGQAESSKDKLSQRACCCRSNKVRVLRSKSPSDIVCISLVNHNENIHFGAFGENTGITESVDPENINSLPSVFAEE